MQYRFLRYPGGKSKAVTFSYDDGSRADLKMVSILDKYHMKCTFNLHQISDEGEWGVTADEVKEHILAKGHEVAIHGASHKAHGMLSPKDGIRTVTECRQMLEQTFGRIIQGMAYPDSGIRHWENGASYENVKHYLTDLGVLYARTLGGDNESFALPTDWHAWMPTAKHTNPEIFEYIRKFLETDTEKCYVAARYPRLFYIWGHSFEFEREDNWELLEQICAKLADQEDIWYATNMEICQYVKAYEALVFSMDNTMVYNPTQLEIWFVVGNERYQIKPGETLHLE